jgi:hypothetical protein
VSSPLVSTSAKIPLRTFLESGLELLQHFMHLPTFRFCWRADVTPQEAVQFAEWEQDIGKASSNCITALSLLTCSVRPES